MNPAWAVLMLFAGVWLAWEWTCFAGHARDLYLRRSWGVFWVYAAASILLAALTWLWFTEGVLPALEGLL